MSNRAQVAWVHFSFISWGLEQSLAVEVMSWPRCDTQGHHCWWGRERQTTVRHEVLVRRR